VEAVREDLPSWLGLRLGMKLRVTQLERLTARALSPLVRAQTRTRAGCCYSSTGDERVRCSRSRHRVSAHRSDDHTRQLRDGLDPAMANCTNDCGGVTRRDE
jgi:hypothetical protein